MRLSEEATAANELTALSPAPVKLSRWQGDDKGALHLLSHF